MPSQTVLQPDGRLAVFSTVVDNFTVINADDIEVYEHYLRDMGRREAREKVLRGKDDPTFERWHDSWDRIAMQHGEKGVREMATEIGVEVDPRWIEACRKYEKEREDERQREAKRGR